MLNPNITRQKAWVRFEVINVNISLISDVAFSAYFESGTLVRPRDILTKPGACRTVGHKPRTLYRNCFITPVIRPNDRPESISM
jgi:hypothetical protein